MFQFQKKYFIFTIVLFTVEVLIALFIHDKFVRPYIGDVLVVMLIYCFFKSFLKVPDVPLALAVLLFSYMVETMQYFNLVKHLGLQNSKLANIVIGNSFAWLDMVAYTVGVLIIIVVERFGASTPPKNHQ